MAIRAAIAEATERLSAAGSPTPRLDAEVLLAHAIGRDRSWLFANPDEPLPEADWFHALVERRATGEPVAYIRGFKEWHSLRIRTDLRGLIPRPETELLADAALAEIEERLARGPVVAWDVATGSGAIAVVIALGLADALPSGSLSLIATDVSEPAIELAAENLAAHGITSVQLGRGDLLDGAGASRPLPDVVVANLPYVAGSQVDAEPWLAFEPRLALDGGEDGLSIARRLIAELPGRVASGATVFLEVGAGQADAVRSIAPAGASVAVLPDLAGVDRVVRIEMPQSPA